MPVSGTVARLSAVLVALAGAFAPTVANALTLEASNATGNFWQRPAIYHSEDDGTGVAAIDPLEYYAQGITVSETGMYTVTVSVDYAATLFIYGGAFTADEPLTALVEGYDLYPVNTTLSFQGTLTEDQPYYFVFTGFDAAGTFGPATGTFSVAFSGPGTVQLASVPAPAAALLLASALGAGGLWRRRA